MADEEVAPEELELGEADGEELEDEVRRCTRSLNAGCLPSSAPARAVPLLCCASPVWSRKRHAICVCAAAAAARACRRSWRR